MQFCTLRFPVWQKVSVFNAWQFEINKVFIMSWTTQQKSFCIEGCFSQKSISVIQWAPRSPYLNPSDFYLWEYMMDRVYQDNPQTIAALKEAIVTQIWVISALNSTRVRAHHWHYFVRWMPAGTPRVAPGTCVQLALTGDNADRFNPDFGRKSCIGHSYFTPKIVSRNEFS